MIVEGCVLRHPVNSIRVDAEAKGVLLRNNRFESAPRYEGSGLRDAVVLPPVAAPKSRP